MANLNDRVNVGIGVVVERDGKFLLGKRLSKKHGEGEYSFPGGKPDPRESPVGAAQRELYEETGLIVPRVDLRPLGMWTYDRYEDHEVHFVTLYFLADIGKQEPKNREPEKCESWDWYGPEALPSPLFSGVEEALRALGYGW